MPVHEGVRPIFIVGAPRSGTTLLSVQLAQYIGAVVTPETFFMHRLPRSWAESNQPVPVDEAIEWLRKYPELDQMGLIAEDVCLPEVSIRPSELFRVVLEAFGNVTGHRTVIEKTPLHLYWMRTLHDWFGDAIIIHISRDGRENAAARLALPHGPRGSLQAALSWQVEADHIAHVTKSSGGTWLAHVRLEDLAADPTRVLQELSTQFDLFDTSNSAGHVDKSMNPYEKEWKAKSFKKPSTAAVTSRYHELSGLSQHVVSGVTWDGNLEFGHSTDGRRLAPLAWFMRLLSLPYRSAVKNRYLMLAIHRVTRSLLPKLVNKKVPELANLEISRERRK